MVIDTTTNTTYPATPDQQARAAEQARLDQLQQQRATAPNYPGTPTPPYTPSNPNAAAVTAQAKADQDRANKDAAAVAKLEQDRAVADVARNKVVADRAEKERLITSIDPVRLTAWQRGQEDRRKNVTGTPVELQGLDRMAEADAWTLGWDDKPLEATEDERVVRLIAEVPMHGASGRIGIETARLVLQAMRYGDTKLITGVVSKPPAYVPGYTSPSQPYPVPVQPFGQSRGDVINPSSQAAFNPDGTPRPLSYGQMTNQGLGAQPRPYVDPPSPSPSTSRPYSG